MFSWTKEYEGIFQPVISCSFVCLKTLLNIKTYSSPSISELTIIFASDYDF